ncbi:MAG TPA: hypothetical protein VMK12_12410 [Anaeromyxobacteraceae bacterium]|nr:hypothetical protein [Anaeromyxobacteraceae bacterium]
MNSAALMLSVGPGRCCVAAALCVLAACPGARARVLALKADSEPHKIEARLSGPGDVLELVFDARAGDHLTVGVVGAGGVRGTVISPSGAQEGGPGGVIINQAAKETGTYRLRVTESPMGEAWTGTVLVTIALRPP